MAAALVYSGSVDEGGSLCGIITRGDVLRAIEEFENPNLTVLDAGSRNLMILYEAIEKMIRNDIGRFRSSAAKSA